jgi:hypothetical protein
MSDQPVRVLNALLAAEYANLIQRLGEATPFVTGSAAADSLLVQQMLADHRRHLRDLAAMIQRLRGTPVPPNYPTSIGGVHYLRLDYLMPQVIAGLRRLIQTYETCGGAGHPEADALIAGILADHRRHLAELQRLHANLFQSA